jgi:hypothetical protein
MGQLINIKVCLSDLPKDKIFTSEKTGKKYIDLTVDERREPDTYGNTHSVSVGQSKEERERRDSRIYVGNGKAYTFGQNQQKQESAQIDDKDGLPF